jgi:hypothetical protein
MSIDLDSFPLLNYEKDREGPLRIVGSVASMLGVLLPDLERYYKSSVPDSILAAIWFTGTTKKSHAYSYYLGWTTKTPVVLLVSFPSY